MARPRVLNWIFIQCKCGVSFETFRPERAKYCSKKCFYKYRTRPRGLSYKIKASNVGWFKFRGGTINRKGYRVVNKRLEHRSIMEKYIGRKLHTNEVIHHINGNKLDNRLENLQLLSKIEHDKFHRGKSGKGRVGICVS